MKTTTVEVRGQHVSAVEIGRHGKLVPTRQVLLVIYDIDTLDDVKSRARELVQIARDGAGPQLKHSEALEAIAKVMGHESFPALQTKLNGGSHGR